MQPPSFEEIAQAVHGRLECRISHAVWTGRVQIDSREIQPGDIFVALPGAQRDGHEFVSAAWALGATLAIVRDDQITPGFGPRLVVADPQAALATFAKWHRQCSDALVIGVTGSAGKTTTRELIFAALSGQFQGMRSRKNYNNELGLPLSLLDLQAEHEFAVLEMGAARVGEIAQLADIALPEVGVITSIGSAHWETFGGTAGILQGKGELLDALPAGGFAVLPGDCPQLRSLTGRARCRVIHVGELADNSLRATRCEQTDFGLRFRVDHQDYEIPVTGKHNLTNALCAIAIGREIGIPSGVLAESLAEFQPVAGRCQLRRIGSWTVLDDTYNASPPAFKAALATLSELPRSESGRRIVITGDMLELGDVAHEEHHQLGIQIGQRSIDRLIAMGRYADDVAAGALAAGMPTHRIAIPATWNTLELLLDCWLEPNDLVLVKGSRGMKMERVIDWLIAATAVPPVAPLSKCA